MKLRIRNSVLIVLAVVTVGVGLLWQTRMADAQRFGGGRYRSFDEGGYIYPERTIFPDNKFVFCRLRYTSYGEGDRNERYGLWLTDYPESDEHFSWRISELTTLRVPKAENGEFEHAIVSVRDEKLFEYPFVYMIEPGRLTFSEEDAANLRNYLLRGGFMMVDDFWGEGEWQNFEAEMTAVFDPVEYPIVELELDHPIFHMVFDLDVKPQVPTPQGWASGRWSEARGPDSGPHYRGIFDREGRLMVVICHNTDLGDGWEREGMNIGYFEEVSAKLAYPMGINIVVYAMTH